MAKIINWKLVLLVIGIFSISMFILPVVITESTAADNPVVLAGLFGGAATTTGMTMGQIGVLAGLGVVFVYFIVKAFEGGDSAVTHQ